MRGFATAVAEGVAAGRERFEHDRMLQVWIEYHLLLLGEATDRIRAELDAVAPGVPWGDGDVVGLRNVIIHGRTIEALLATRHT